MLLSLTNALHRQLYQTTRAICYLHDKCGFVHGDIKGDNILVSKDHTVLLSGFGLSKSTNDGTSENLKGEGTIAFQSPEILAGGSKTFESDIYAFGMTIYEVEAPLAGQLPVHLH